MRLKLIAVLVGLLGMNAALADEDKDKILPCPIEAQVQMDTLFGPGTSAQTECVQKRDNIRVAMAWNNRDLNRNGIGQQVFNAMNYVEMLEGVYGLNVNTNYEITVVGYQAGARWLLTDAAYNRTVGVTTGNPSRASVEWLLSKGMKMVMCQNTMRNSGYVTADLLPGVTQVPGGIAALVDLSMRGYTYLVP